METPDFMVQLRAQLETSASESGSGSNSTSQGANSSDVRCVLTNSNCTAGCSMHDDDCPCVLAGLSDARRQPQTGHHLSCTTGTAQS